MCSRSTSKSSFGTLIKIIGEKTDSRTNPHQLRELAAHLRVKEIATISKLLRKILQWVQPIRTMWNYCESLDVPLIREAPAGTDPRRFFIGLIGNVQVLDLTSRRESEQQRQSNPSLT